MFGKCRPGVLASGSLAALQGKEKSLLQPEAVGSVPMRLEARIWTARQALWAQADSLEEEARTRCGVQEDSPWAHRGPSRK